MKLPKVLVGVVTYEGKDYIMDDCYKAVNAFDYPNFDVVVVDNSSGTNYVRKLRRRGYKNVVHVQRADNAMSSIARSQEFLRKKALKDDYDYLLLVESDLLPPPHTINQLIRRNVDVVGALYLIGHGDGKYPCVMMQNRGHMGAERGHRILGTLPTKEGLAPYKEEMDWFKEQYAEGKMVRCVGCGFGTTLFKRYTLNKFMFRPMQFSGSEKTMATDSYVYLVLNDLGIPVYVDTGLFVKHYPSKWDDVKDRWAKDPLRGVRNGRKN